MLVVWLLSRLPESAAREWGGKGAVGHAAGQVQGGKDPHQEDRVQGQQTPWVLMRHCRKLKLGELGLEACSTKTAPSLHSKTVLSVARVHRDQKGARDPRELVTGPPCGAESHSAVLWRA